MNIKMKENKRGRGLTLSMEKTIRRCCQVRVEDIDNSHPISMISFLFGC